MKKRRSAEQIVGLLQQADVDLGKGASVPDVCRQLCISQQPYYCWRTKFSGMDPFTRERLVIEVARSFTARDVIMTRKECFTVRGAPEHLRSDNGPEFVAKEFEEWLARPCVRTLSIQKASPWENGYVKSYNGRLRDELRDRELFLSLLEA